MDIQVPPLSNLVFEVVIWLEGTKIRKCGGSRCYIEVDVEGPLESRPRKSDLGWNGGGRQEMSIRDYTRAEVDGDKKKCKGCQAWKHKDVDFNKWEGKCKMCRSAKRKGITIQEEMARLSLRSGIRSEELEELKQEVARLTNESLQAQDQTSKANFQLQETIGVLQRSQTENEKLKENAKKLDMEKQRLENRIQEVEARKVELEGEIKVLKSRVECQEVEIRTADEGWLQLDIEQKKRLEERAKFINQIKEMSNRETGLKTEVDHWRREANANFYEITDYDLMKQWIKTYNEWDDDDGIKKGAYIVMIGKKNPEVYKTYEEAMQRGNQRHKGQKWLMTRYSQEDKPIPRT